MMGTQSWSPRFIRILLAALVVVFLVAWGEREASAEVELSRSYEVLILRLEKPEGASMETSSICQWWYLVWYKGERSWTMYPIVPEGWLQHYGCQATAISGDNTFEVGQ